MLNVALAVLVFMLAAISDFLETRYVQAVHSWNDSRHVGQAVRAREQAARCSVAMWFVGVIGLIAVVEAGWWLLIPEGAGLYVGTMRAMR